MIGGMSEVERCEMEGEGGHVPTEACTHTHTHLQSIKCPHLVCVHSCVLLV